MHECEKMKQPMQMLAGWVTNNNCNDYDDDVDDTDWSWLRCQRRVCRTS